MQALEKLLTLSYMKVLNQIASNSCLNYSLGFDSKYVPV